MSDSLVSVKAVNKTYQRGGEKLVVLDDLSLEVPKGDFLALMGPSGSGKSTLLNLIGGLDTPTSGSVEVDGERLDALNSKALSKWRSSHVGFIFQFYNLLPVLTAFRNVELPLLLTKLSGSQRKQHVETALNIVSLADIVCDEPTGDLDRDTATDILNLLQILNRDHGKTILMVTHDPMAADSAKRILHLDKGKLTH